jgi:hypothetical protein
LGLLLLAVPVAHVDRSTSERIRVGMHLSEVERVVGASPGYHDGVVGHGGSWPDYKNGWWPRGHWEYVDWVGWRGMILVKLDDSARVTRVGFYETTPAFWSPLDFLFERVILRFFAPCEWCAYAHAEGPLVRVSSERPSGMPYETSAIWSR